MRRFRFDSVECDEDHPDFSGLLARAYRTKVRPLCLCREPAAPMYIADIGNQLVIKRMPLSGGGHDPACPSYEPPYELSGLGPLMGSAIQMDASVGIASLKLDFSLSKRAASNRPGVTEPGGESVKAEGRKLSLRALLHFLWHDSGLTEWTAHWAGKRHCSWGRIGKAGGEKTEVFGSEREAAIHFLDIARRKKVKGYKPVGSCGNPAGPSVFAAARR